MNDKYTLAQETKTVSGHTLHRIKALKDIAYARVGQLGGWIETEKNLSGSGDAWVAAEARVFADAQVFGDALVFGDATVAGNACISGNARVGDRAWISETAWVTDDALVSGRARVSGQARIEDGAWVGDHAWIAGKVTVSGYARARGYTRLVNNEYVSGQTMIADPPPQKLNQLIPACPVCKRGRCSAGRGWTGAALCTRHHELQGRGDSPDRPSTSVIGAGNVGGGSSSRRMPTEG